MKLVITSIILSIALVISVVLLTQSNDSSGGSKDTVGTATLLNGKQIVDITARGGYFPRITTASANVPTIIRVETKGTIDCSAALTIPAVNYRAYLPRSGITEIEVPAQSAGSTVRGLCSMGMYSFVINFN